MQDILSVGIDIGTSTTQVIFSRLHMENTSSYFTVPKVSIVDKQIVYKSRIYMTPLKNDVLIDTQQVRKIVAGEFERAGFKPEDTGSGAVIITGESARKENADAVLKELSEFAGDFVVSAAGPDMESVIAGKGSGAFKYSKDNHCAVINADVGGGTSNFVLFKDGKVMAKGCLDIGGRLICVSKTMTVEKLSHAAALAAKEADVFLEAGRNTEKEALQKIVQKMAETFFDEIEGKKTRLTKILKTPGSSDFNDELGKNNGNRTKYICFSGGVADAVYKTGAEPFAYGDIGVLLGNALRAEAEQRSYRLIDAGETIRATVIGAGMYTTTVSGSTITYQGDIFPIKNIPVLKLTPMEEADCFSGVRASLLKKLQWFLAQSKETRLILAIKGLKNPDYSQLKTAADVFSEVMASCLDKEVPIIMIVENDIAKALGQLMRVQMKERTVIVLDSIAVEDGDYVDMGRPVMDGLVIPVVVKTLVFG